MGPLIFSITERSISVPSPWITKFTGLLRLRAKSRTSRGNLLNSSPIGSMRTYIMLSCSASMTFITCVVVSTSCRA
ncbi:MAG: hypothetical protein FJ035_08730 [Chloroflexi bacterium]|nr:hypothetical protein [Chloroflexota bacterium]